MSGKIYLKLQETIRKMIRKPIVFANGCFDVLHSGHFAFLKFCVKIKEMYNTKLIVAIDTDEKITYDKGCGRPIFNLSERENQLLYAFPEIDCVYTFGSDNELESLIKSVRSVILVKDEAWRGHVVGSHWVENIIYFPRSKNVDISTSKIIEKIRA